MFVLFKAQYYFVEYFDNLKYLKNFLEEAQ